MGHSVQNPPQFAPGYGDVLRSWGSLFTTPSTLNRISMHLRRYWDTPLFVELLLLAITAPVLYFPGRFEGQDLFGAVGILAAGWVWRRLTIGIWYRRTPADWPLFFLLLVLLPIALWTAPDPLRQEYAIPRALILIWNFALFWTVVSHAGRREELFNLSVAGFGAIGVGIAVASLFGTQWSSKFPVIGPMLTQLPKPLAGLFGSSVEGFNPNQVGGSLLYVLPLLLALAAYGFLRQRSIWLTWVPAGLAATICGGVLVLSQSRGSLLGLGVGFLLILLLNWRWGHWIVVVGVAAAVTSLAILPLDSLSSALESAKNLEQVTGALTLEGRIEVWSRALQGIQDFSFTGMGLGTFRQIVRLLYPLFIISPSMDLAHAHNFFLQVALDFGIPGLIAILACYGIAALLIWEKWNQGDEERVWAAGFLGVLVAQSIYSMTDAVAMGSKVNFLFWWFFALLFARFWRSAKNTNRTK